LIEMNWRAGTSHLGGSLSVVEILVTLYRRVMRFNPGNAGWPGRDRLVLSKAHASAAWYAMLAALGFFPRERLFDAFITCGGTLQEHADMRRTPGVDMSGGSLGQGLSAGAGMAWATRRRPGTADVRVFVVLGDGECQEGQVWEAAMAASHLRLDNLVAVVDYNRLQVSGRVSDVMEIAPLADKWGAFGWQADEVDGHDIEALAAALRAACVRRDGHPSVIVAHTTKGKGISFVEDDAHWHGGSLSAEQYRQALAELDSRERALRGGAHA
jgi:transketolase